MKNVIGILIGSVLNIQIAFGSIAMFTMLIFADLWVYDVFTSSNVAIDFFP
jgi:hypothetical protein